MPKPIVTTLDNWPKDRTGIPIFTSSQDALLYAQLIEKVPDKQKMLMVSRQDSYIKLRAERHAKHPNLQRMCDLAVKAQLFRESLEEVQRIKDELFRKQGE